MEPTGTSGESLVTGERYRFGEIVVDALAHTLSRAGLPQSVEPKAFAVLLVLLRHAGELVERDRLLDLVWGHRHVTPGVLTRAIAQLRGALDDHPQSPRYIQTQHALGYRFIGALLPEPVPAAREKGGVPGSVPAEPAETPDPLEVASGSSPRAAGRPPFPTPAPVPALAAAPASAAVPADNGTDTPPVGADRESGALLPTAGASAGPARPPAPVHDGGHHAGTGVDGHPPAVYSPDLHPAMSAPAGSSPSLGAHPGAAGRAPLLDDSGPVAARRRVLPGPAWLGWATLLLAALIAALVLVARQRGDVPPRPAEASIAVLPFVSLGDDSGDRYFVEGLAVEMQDALAGVPGLKVASRAAAASVQQANPDPRAVGGALGVATVLDASVRREGRRVRINARLSDTATGFTLWSHSYERETADVFAVQSEIAGEVVQALLGVLPGEPALRKRLTPTHDLAAYEAYLKGVQQLQGSADDDQLEKAIASFNEALAGDASFARAQAGICRAELMRFENSRDTPAFERARSACMHAARMDPELREVSLALGDMHRVRGEFAEASRQYTRALDDTALRPQAYLGLARTQSAQGRIQVALDYFERARRLLPRDPVVYRERGYQQYLNGDLAGAIESYRVAAGLLPGDAELWSSLGGLYMVNGDNANAIQALERSVAIRPSYGALSNLGTLRYETGAYAEAVDLYRHAAELDPKDYRLWGNLGDALSAQPGQAAPAAQAYEQAARMAEAYVGVKGGDAQAQVWLGWYLANLGQADAARRHLAQAEELATERGEVAFVASQTLALLGDERGARTRLERARAEGIPAQRIRSAPALRPLVARVPETRGRQGGTN